jgi:hypothetical protein
MGTGRPRPAPDGQTADQLVDDNTEAQLREIADTEGADISSAKNKAKLPRQSWPSATPVNARAS